jgi:hypothetical protein
MSETNGGITLTAPTNAIIVGTAISATQLLIQHKTSKITRYYTSSDVWTKPAGIKYVEVELVGGGGGSIDAINIPVSGGGAGGYARGKITANLLGTTVAITVGPGGSWRSYPNSSSGYPGGASSFGTLVAAGGGSGGGTNPGSGGMGTAGDLLLAGEPGRNAFYTYSQSYVNGGPAYSIFNPYGNGGGPSQSGSSGIVIVNEYF